MPHSLFAQTQDVWSTPHTPGGTPLGVLPALVPHQPALLPRFAMYYTQLRALPRRVRRVLQRQGRLSLVGIALLLALGPSPVQAATIPVTGSCTLVAAILAANTDRPRGGCPAGSGADTLVLPVGSTQTLTQVHNTTYGATGLPVIRSVITIAGRGSTITRDKGAPNFRLLAVSRTGDLTLTETRVSGGYLYVGSGSGVANYGGTLAVVNSTISGNSVEDTGRGGGVHNSAGGTTTITNSTISGNFSYDDGGGVENAGGTVTIMESTISDNDIECCQGGGVVNTGGTVTITRSTISDNGVGQGDGGGVVNRSGGTVTIMESTISGNHSGDDGAGGGG